MFTTPRRLLLTGTPLQNNLKELWSLFDFVFPGKLGTLVVFQQHFDVPIAIGGYANATKSEVHAAYRCAVTLRDLVSPYMLRRMKADVAIQLPEKQEQVLFCRLSQEQREAYEHFLGSRTVKAVLAGRLNLLYAINVLRQICNHVDIATSSTLWDGRRHCTIVRSYDDDDCSGDDGSDCNRERAVVDGKFGNVARSGKLMVLQTVLEKWKTAGNRVLIFSQTHIVLDILAGFARQSHYEFRRMDGKVAIAKRMELIDEFNSDENIFLFLLSTKVGGLGTNLTGADRVVRIG
jgi:DNA excision repair protein ERCC-6